MARFRHAASAIVLLCAPAAGTPADFDPSGWSVAVSPHFEVYSQAGAESAKRTLSWFEEIRAFLDQSRILGFKPGSREEMRPVRVVEFRTAQQYAAVKFRPLADAYFASLNDSNYIAMPVLSTNGFAVAAHEYTHYALHAAGAKVPSWLNEGLAEVLATVTVTNHGWEFGGEIAARAQVLRRGPWIPAAGFFQAERSDTDDPIRASAFYAQSWAVADMLVNAPAFTNKIADLIEFLNSGVSSSQAFQRIYGRSAEDLLADAQQWLHFGGSRRRKLPTPASNTVSTRVTDVGERQVQAVIAATNGDLDRAKRLYEELLARSPRDPTLLASLGTLALRQGRRSQAIEYWRSAVSAGLQDADLCYRYAQLADQMDESPEEVRQALEYVVGLRPHFDDARYRLAQMDSNRGDYAAALVQLQAIRNIPPKRAFGYWTMLSSALNELGRHEEAAQAAAEAQRVAADGEQSARAAQLAHFARTEMQVQYVRNAEGKLQLVTTRVPRGLAVNPFIEAQDQIRSEFGVLLETQCAEERLTAVVVKMPAHTVTLSVADPRRVLIKAGPAEFVCGPQQQEIAVNVEYALADQPQGWRATRLRDFGRAYI